MEKVIKWEGPGYYSLRVTYFDLTDNEQKVLLDETYIQEERYIKKYLKYLVPSYEDATNIRILVRFLRNSYVHE